MLVIIGLIIGGGTAGSVLAARLSEDGVTRVVNRLRAIAEHGGMQRSDDRRRTTHHVRQSLLARVTMSCKDSTSVVRVAASPDDLHAVIDEWLASLEA